ncbi:MAG: CDP-alcohol phosphatidyltransferase family protein [Thermodesulfobacteriota bacterium]
MNLPNIMTLTRVLLIPVFIILIINKSFWGALITFAIAGITDGIDGLIARITHQRTELGAYLDPIADKLLLISAFITLAIIEIIPSWLAVIVITRDVIILLGFLVLMLTNYHPKIQPSLLSKVTTDFQIATVLLVLLRGYYPVFDQLSVIGIYGSALFTILSGSHYIYVGTRILNQKK